MLKEKGEELIKITIKRKRLLELLQSDMEIRLLEAGGVDNWEWHGDSLNPDGEPDFFERAEEIEKMVEDMPFEGNNGNI